MVMAIVMALEYVWVGIGMVHSGALACVNAILYYTPWFFLSFSIPILFADEHRDGGKRSVMYIMSTRDECG